ncbi:metabotropic glutamate receptor 1-like [Planococcus citri]|uniref:metabotropic glutamate receptor 1-like n=1 Tax=Planococcus citri TaxID=170843 RepID=UPI0031F830EE
MFIEIVFTLILQLNIAAFEPSLSDFDLNVAEKVRKGVFIEGDFIIGALFSVHVGPRHDSYPLKCGPINSSEGIELVEAALFAIDAINKDKKLLPGIKLGINIKDDCEDERIALYQTMNMIKEPKFGEEMIDFSSPINCTKKYSGSPLIGMIGTLTKLNMLHYENLLKLFKIPQIGYSTSLSELISPYYYLSVVPSDYHLALLIIKILKKFNWTYVSMAYSNEYFGMNGKYFLEQWVSSYNICISNSVHIRGGRENVAYVNTVNQLFQSDKAKVIVCFCDETSLKRIFHVMREFELTGKYFILNSYEWPISEEFLSEYQAEAEGMLMIALRNNLIPGFDGYFSSLKLNSNERNPWFDEYSNSKYINLNSNSTSKNSKIPYVIKSIYAFAQGLQDMVLDICGSSGASLQCLRKKPFNTSKYMEYLIDLDFRFFNVENVEFSFHGSPQIGKFDIYNFQKTPKSPNSSKFVKVGYYDCHHYNSSKNFFHDLHLFEDKIEHLRAEKITSVCSEGCSLGQIQVIDKDRLCCWQCIDCEETEYVYNKTKCIECEPGFLPNSNKTACKSAPTKYMGWDDPRSLIAAGISCGIIILALMTANIFARNRHTAVIRSSSASLDYIMLCGVIILSGCNFTLMMKPNVIVCVLAKTLPSVGVSLIYIPVIFKTLQIFYVLKAMKNRDPKFPSVINSLKAQVAISSIMVILETVILISWILIQEQTVVERTIRDEPETSLHIHLKCAFKKKHWLDIVFIAMHIIMIYYVIRIRKLSHNFHEAKFLAIFAFVQTSTNVTFRIVYNSSIFQIDSMFMAFSLDSFVTLLFLFFPKLYVIIWRPEINTDDNFKSFIARYYSYQ